MTVSPCTEMVEIAPFAVEVIERGDEKEEEDEDGTRRVVQVTDIQ